MNCPHCGADLPDGAASCPHCGTPQLRVWPPPPQGSDAPVPPTPPRTLTGRAWTDFLLGAAGQYLAHLATARLVASGPSSDPSDPVAIGLAMIFECFCVLVCGALGYFSLRGFFPWMARGSGYTTLLLFVVLLGALFTCRLLVY